VAGDGAAIEGGASLVARTTTSTSAQGVRFELEARVPVSYRVRASSGRIQLRLEALPEAAGDEGASEVPVVSGAAEPERATEAATGPVSVRGVSIERRDGRDRVIVSLSRAADFRLLPGRVGP